MAERIAIADQFTVGAQPDSDDWQKLHQQGFRTVINLRVDNEDEDMLRPMEEGDQVRQQGMEYMHLPVSMKQVRAEQADEFCHAIDNLDGPFFVHCKMGKRAAAFSILPIAKREGWSGQQALDELARKGMDLGQSPMADFVRDYVDSQK